MTELLIRNGFVHDPMNGIKGERMDIAIKDGKIVDRVNERRAKVLDVSEMLVMPGGVDIHTHIAGAEVNTGRLLRPEDHFRDFEHNTILTRSGVGRSIPSTFTTGYRYARMGYTTIMNPSMPPLEAKHTHEELNDTPIVDKASYPLLGDWWFTLEFLAAGNFEELARYVAWMMKSTRGYAIKVVNPGGLEAWGFGGNVQSLDEQVPNFCITPREIIRGLCRVNTMLNLPHTVHLHTNNLGKPGNCETTLETMKSVEDLGTQGKPVIHITHCQFSAYVGDDWRSLASGADKVANYINDHSHVTVDMGQVIFTRTTTMTADGPFQFGLCGLTGNKWANHDVETETSAGIVPFHYRRKNYAHSIQWTIGLELALLIKDPWKIFLTTDHPNGGPFTFYPRIIAWLMSKKARKATLKTINARARSRSVLPSIDRELDFDEIAILTRAGPARALGLAGKGHLGVGADADIAVYDFDPEKTDVSKRYKVFRKALKRAAFTIKSGEIVVKDGEIVQSADGSTIWIDVDVSEHAHITDDMKRKFRQYWTVEFENYPVTEHYLKTSRPIRVKAEF